MNRRPVADLLPARCRGLTVEDRGEENRAALGVEVEHFGGVRREAEPVLCGPGRHVRPAALKDGDVESVDAHLLQHLHRLCRVELNAQRL